MPEIPAPEILNADLLTVYPMGDPHLGMYAWAAETGTDFDLEIAERNLTAATVRLVMASPPSEEALIVNVGDFFHGDTSANRTLRSGHGLGRGYAMGKGIARRGANHAYVYRHGPDSP